MLPSVIIINNFDIIIAFYEASPFHSFFSHLNQMLFNSADNTIYSLVGRFKNQDTFKNDTMYFFIMQD